MEGNLQDRRVSAHISLKRGQDHTPEAQSKQIRRDAESVNSPIAYFEFLPHVGDCGGIVGCKEHDSPSSKGHKEQDDPSIPYWPA